MSEAVVRYAEAGDEQAVIALYQSEARGEHNWERELTKMMQDPEYRPHRWAFAEVDGELASAGLMLPRKVRIGDAVLEAGLIGWVVTAEKHRRMGYGSLVMRALQELLEREQMDYGYLSASPVGLLLYSYLGWQVFLDDVYVELPMSEACTLAPRDRDYDVVPISETSTDDLCALYDDYSRRTPGAIVRTPQYMGWLVDYKLSNGHIDRGLSFGAFRGDRLCAYLLGRQGNFHVPEEGLFTVTEAVARPGDVDAFGAILPVLCNKAPEAGYDRLRLGLHSEHPLMVWADKKRARRAYDPLHDMALITNLERFIISMGPELHNRLADSRWASIRTTFGIATEKRSAVVGVDGTATHLTAPLDAEHVINIREEDVVGWLLGHSSIRALVNTGLAWASSAASLDLAETLFPRVELWQSHLDC